MNTNSTLPCAGCSRYLGDVMQPLVVDFDGFRYRLCGYGCADRLMARLSRSSTTTTSVTNETCAECGRVDIDAFMCWRVGHLPKDTP